VAECRRVTADEAAACARAARMGLDGGQPVDLARRGPGQPGSARRAPGEYLSRAAGFAAGMLLDVMPGCNALAGFAAEAAGDDDTYHGARDDEVAGAIAAWDRVEAHAAARKHAAVAEFIGQWAAVEDIDATSCRVRMTADSLDWPVMALGAVDAGFQVVSPPELLDRVRDWGRRFSQASVTTHDA
jgi:WYL domain